MKEKSVTKILESRGIRYSHRNDEILVPNTIEEQQMKKARKERRQRDKKAKERKAPMEPEFEWPPRRRHHTRPPSPRTKLMQRSMALIALGLIQSSDDIPAFAQNFVKKTPEEQTELLAKLDAHGATRTS